MAGLITRGGNHDMVGVAPVRTPGPFNNRPLSGALGMDSPAAAGRVQGAAPIGQTDVAPTAGQIVGGIVLMGALFFGVGWAVGKGLQFAER